MAISNLANGLKMPQFGQGDGPRPNLSVNIPSGQQSLRPANMVGGNNVLPKSQIVDSASGPAHSGGTSDVAGIEYAKKKHLGNLHSSQTPMPQPMMNQQFNSIPMVPGGLTAKKIGMIACRKKSAIPLAPIFRQMWRDSKPIARQGVKDIASGAKAMGKPLLESGGAAARDIGQGIAATGKRLVGNSRVPASVGPKIKISPQDIAAPASVGLPASSPKMPRTAWEPPVAPPKFPKYTVSPGRGPAGTTTSSIASPQPSPVGRVDVYAGIGSEGGSAATNPALKSVSRGTRIQGKPSVTQMADHYSGSVAMPPKATDLGAAAAKEAPAAPGFARRALSGIGGFGASMRDAAGYSLGGGLGVGAVTPFVPALDAVIPGAGTAAQIIGGLAGGVAGGKAFSKARGWKSIPVTAGGILAPLALPPMLGGIGEESAAGVPANDSYGYVPGYGMLPYANNQGPENSVGVATPQPSSAAPAATTAPVASSQQGASSSGDQQEHPTTRWQKLKFGIKSLINNEIDQNDPVYKEEAAKMIGSIGQTWNGMGVEDRVKMAREMGLGPLGELFVRFSALPGPVQGLLSVGLFMGMGGLLGGQGGAIGGAALGLGPLILSNWPAIQKMWQDVGQPGAEGTADNPVKSDYQPVPSTQASLASVAPQQV